MKIELSKQQQEALINLVSNSNFIGKEWEFVRDLLETLNKEVKDGD